MSKVPLSSGELTQARRVANVEVALKEDMVLLSSLGKAADPAFEGQRWRLENTQCPLALSCVLGCIHMCCLDLLPFLLSLQNSLPSIQDICNSGLVLCF